MADVDEYTRWRHTMNAMLADIQSNLKETPPAHALGPDFDPIASAFFHCSNGDYEALRQEIHRAVHDAVQKLDERVQSSTRALTIQMDEREQELKQGLADRLQELLHGHRAIQVQNEAEQKSEMASVRRSLEAMRVRADESARIQSTQSSQCGEALALARRSVLRCDSHDAVASQHHEQVREALARIQGEIEGAAHRIKDVEDEVRGVLRMKEGVDTTLAHLSQSIEDVASEGVLAEAKAQRRLVEMGADLVEMHDLVESQVQENRSLLDAVHKSQHDLLEQCAAQSTRVADARVQAAVTTLTDALERVARDLNDRGLEEERVRGETRTELDALRHLLSSKSDHRITSNMSEEMGEIVKEMGRIGEESARCGADLQSQHQWNRSLRDEFAQLKDGLRSKIDLAQSKAELMFDDLDQKQRRWIQEDVRVELDRQKQRVDDLKQSLAQWTDAATYDGVIEAICERTLERYDLEPGLKASIADAIEQNAARIESDTDGKIDHVMSALARHKQDVDAAQGALARTLRHQVDEHRGAAESVQKQLATHCSTMASWCDDRQRLMRTELRDAMELERAGIEEALRAGRDQAEQEQTAVRAKMCLNAEMVMELGRNHLEEVGKRKEMAKDLVAIRSVLLEIRPDRLTRHPHHPDPAAATANHDADPCRRRPTQLRSEESGSDEERIVPDSVCDDKDGGWSCVAPDHDRRAAPAVPDLIDAASDEPDSLQLDGSDLDLFSDQD